MEQYIDKDVLAKEIERLKDAAQNGVSYHQSRQNVGLNNELSTWEHLENAFMKVLKIIDTLEVKEVDTWHLQEKEDIYDAVKDWSFHTFACVMKDGTIQKFSGSLDEDCEGHVHVHIYGVNDDYDDVDDIVKWIEYT